MPLSPTATLVVFTISWWLVFFLILPFGNVSYSETETDAGLGTEPGAPVRPRLKRKALIATAAATLITGSYVLAVTLGGFSIRGLVTGG